ncbi:beta-lactamase family protein [Subsaximicrobium wynnwilliamsii]|uniref:Beta-lactamase family protein n=2 Tax=Subsaximicrobium wynnwilliamsii TaxID=291179 RepID=A0A5C6ZM20_9FLAO|nr:beta-lactamase family protein [Subsaximicrobium wynnwilliamsii]TXD90311.1 beta-lactamase family protein [Subsaximicrobium wynnwilliamsii]TXE04362.1 beta-lactamase family protein [Subsaximicrobium wynnwilliamsii]
MVATHLETVAATAIKPQSKEKSPILIERYPENTTKGVRHKLDSLLQRINERHDFHGAILVAKNNKVLYNNQIGYADFNKKTPLHEESAFQLASVSKQFTAAAIMLLNERNQIKLTDTVNAYFPDFPYADVTIENLLNHTGGLPKYFWVAEHKWQQEKAPINSEMMALLESSNVQRFFKPGRTFDYSNTGYIVLASIVEKVSGTSFSSFLKSNIFEPLEMKHSYVYSFENDSIKENQLDGYRLYRGWRHLKIRGTVNDAIVGDKNVYTTTEDLFKWTLGLNTGKLLTKASLDLMYSEGETVHGRKIPYGFGFRIDTKEKNRIYHHGRWNGFGTGLTKYLEDDLVVIVLEHTSYKAIRSLNEKIKDIVTEHFGT